MASLPRVLMITSEWPTPDKPYQVPFIVRQVDFLRRAGIELDLFTFRGGKRPQNYARAWLQANRQIATKKYDLIHAQWGQSGMLALPKRIPLVVTFRGDDLEGIIGAGGKHTIQGYILQSFSKLVAMLADEVIVVSETLARKLPHRRYHVIPSGLDLDLFRPMSREEARKRLGLPNDRHYVLFAGMAGNPRKRFDLAKAVIEQVCQEMDVELLVASNVEHSQIPIYMNASSALLLTSLHEGSPNVVKEALACNIPVVSTQVGDVQDRIGHLPGCIVCPDDRPETIAANLLQVLRLPERPEIRQTVKELDENLLTQKVIQVYRQALN